MKYFAVFLPLKDAKKSQETRPEHLAFLKQMREEKKVLMNGRFTDGSGGLVIYVAEDQNQVEAWVKEDPYIKSGARSYEIHEWEMVTDAHIQV